MPETETAPAVRSREITITRTFAASRDVVFRALTDAAELARWWGPEGYSVPAATSDPRLGGEWTIVMRAPDGSDTELRGTYTEFVAPERFSTESTVFDANGTRLIEATNVFVLAARDGATEMTLTARASVFSDEMLPALAGMKAGWAQSLQRLDDVFTGAEERQLVVMHLFQAPPERVFEMFTSPEHLERWRGPDGPNVITYEEISAPDRLVYVHGSSPDAGEPPCRVTVTFDEMSGMTVLGMRLVFATPDDRDITVAKYHADEGARQTLARLEAYLTELSS